MLFFIGILISLVYADGLAISASYPKYNLTNTALSQTHICNNKGFYSNFYQQCMCHPNHYGNQCQENTNTVLVPRPNTTRVCDCSAEWKVYKNASVRSDMENELFQSYQMLGVISYDDILIYFNNSAATSVEIAKLICYQHLACTHFSINTVSSYTNGFTVKLYTFQPSNRTLFFNFYSNVSTNLWVYSLDRLPGGAKDICSNFTLSHSFYYNTYFSDYAPQSVISLSNTVGQDEFGIKTLWASNHWTMIGMRFPTLFQPNSNCARTRAAQGLNCSVEICPWDTNTEENAILPCSYHGYCSSTGACQCDLEYQVYAIDSTAINAGATNSCSSVIAPCYDGVEICKSIGVCNKLYNNTNHTFYTACVCNNPLLWSGTYCQTSACLNASTGVSCEYFSAPRHGECVLIGSSPTCVCDPYWFGSQCENADSQQLCYDSSSSDEFICNSHGTCRYINITTNTTQCSCDTGYSGAYCSLHSCTSCVHGSCPAVSGPPVCNCKTNSAGLVMWNGTNCNQSLCLGNVTSNPLYDECTCPAGFLNTTLDNDPPYCDSRVCGSYLNQMCGGYVCGTDKNQICGVCIANNSLSANRSTCVCNTDAQAVLNNVTGSCEPYCLNGAFMRLSGSPTNLTITCVCNTQSDGFGQSTGYYGSRCQYNSCGSHGTWSLTNNNCTCEDNWNGNYNCTTCSSGYWGSSCTKCSECIHGTCNTTNGACICNSGYTGSACGQDICFGGCANGTCINNSTKCRCLPGYYAPNGTGTACTGYVGDVICNKRGYAANFSDTCQCEEGYSGLNCSIQICNPPCDYTRYQCSHNATCICKSGLVGPFCNYTCGYVYCSGHGTCINSTSACICNTQYTGSNCSLFVPSPTPSPYRFPTSAPTLSPTQNPTASPSIHPTPSPTPGPPIRSISSKGEDYTKIFIAVGVSAGAVSVFIIAYFVYHFWYKSPTAMGYQKLKPAANM